MEKKEIFDKIYKDIKENQKAGKIIKAFGPDEIGIVKVEELCQQGVEGLLYDLDLDEAVLATLYKDDPLKFADYMAISEVIRFLHKFYTDNKQKPKE